MRSQRIRLLAGTAALAALVATGARAGDIPVPRCRVDTLNRVWCAEDDGGVAVVGDLGSVRCASGECVEFRDAWHCASQPGGEARRVPEGVECDGGCVQPSQTECHLME